MGDERNIVTSCTRSSLILTSAGISSVAAACSPAESGAESFSKSQMLETMHVSSSAHAPTSSCFCNVASRRCQRAARLSCARGLRQASFAAASSPALISASRTSGVVCTILPAPMLPSESEWAWRTRASWRASSSASCSRMIFCALKFEKMRACIGVRRSWPMHWVKSLKPSTTDWLAWRRLACSVRSCHVALAMLPCCSAMVHTALATRSIHVKRAASCCSVISLSAPANQTPGKSIQDVKISRGSSLISPRLVCEAPECSGIVRKSGRAPCMNDRMRPRNGSESASIVPV
mmetsp:Transcript_43145/g.113324  ORF Transcript_43145/g.113324 Transcript_43145/m.113324 type:complete len:292 (-) Transcript_43145:243-1118(-)